MSVTEAAPPQEGEAATAASSSEEIAPAVLKTTKETTEAPKQTADDRPKAAVPDQPKKQTRRKKKRRANKDTSSSAKLQHLLTQIKQLCLQDKDLPPLLEQASRLVEASCMGNGAENIYRQEGGGTKIPTSVWKPQKREPAMNPHPPQQEVRLTALERLQLAKDRFEKELRARFRNAISVSEFEALCAEAEKAGMHHEARLAQKKIEQLKALDS